ncbi:MAG: LAGLIDADG family homing endonuclease [Candidatus Hodarchaeales archaeon]|jgi:hypothetical protein
MKESGNLIFTNKKSRWTAKEIQFLKKNSFLKDIEISGALNRSINSIRGKRRRLGINKKFQSKYNINLNFFKIWTIEMAYILGYIFADGSIRIRRSGSELSMKSKDFELLELINDAMISNYPIKEIKSKTGIYYTLAINRKEIVYDLLKLGVIPRKSKTMTFPEVQERFLYHFIRGYFDGDGHVRILGNSLEIVFTSGSKDFLKKLHGLLEFQKIKSKIYPRSHDSHLWFNLSILNKSRKIFYEILYKDPSIFLMRKFLIFQKFFQNNHQITIICQDCGKKVPKTGNNQKRCKDCKMKLGRELNRISYERRKSKMR